MAGPVGTGLDPGLDILTTAGITLAPPPEQEQRAAIAEKRLREERSVDSHNHSNSAGGVGEELSTQSPSDMLAFLAASAAAQAGLTVPAPVPPPAADP